MLPKQQDRKVGNRALKRNIQELDDQLYFSVTLMRIFKDMEITNILTGVVN